MTGRARRIRLLGIAVGLAVVAGGIGWYASRPRPARSAVLQRYAGSAQCAECHRGQFQAWQGSHHAQAERPLDPAVDGSAFFPERAVKHGSVESTVRVQDGRLELVTLGADGRVAPHHIDRVIGVSPLRQFLVPAPGGRWQVSALAFDPHRADWFDVFGDEDRRPHEWGFWANRGMTWNSMCATCHTTVHRKNYDPETDSYRTEYLELGVGCESCHGPARGHVEWQKQHPNQKGDPTTPQVAADRWVDTCGACHARRSELRATFQGGERFLDQFIPELPSEEATYYPDAQVHDENYEYGSFLLSRMYGEGVRCIDCHEPHRAKLRADGNELCLRCHRGKIEPGSHAHHRLDQPGGQCVNCHMPQTTYMQRHPRRDHGLTIPDPLLTRELGIPNACNRCHADKSVDWAIAAVAEWYGPRMQRVTRRRARLVAQARRGDRAAIAPLVEMARSDPWKPWRAVAAGLLDRWVHRPEVGGSLVDLLSDPEPLVRSTAARALDSLEGPARPVVDPALQPLLADPVRAVRVQAAWGLRRTIDLTTGPGRELMDWLDQGSDQPPGAMMLGSLWADRRNPDQAAVWFQRAKSWEPRSPVPRQALAVLLSESGRRDAAIVELEAGIRAIPGNATLHYTLGLALAETRQIERAATELKQACQLDAQFARAWYNLGLAQHALGQPERAITSLQRAETAERDNADFPYTLATIFCDLGRTREAQDALQRALAIDPEHERARLLLQTLRSGGPAPP
jgi:predicted CXXCH cytochrome family protein